jgi:hypothetical protein
VLNRMPVPPPSQLDLVSLLSAAILPGPSFAQDYASRVATLASDLDNSTDQTQRANDCQALTTLQQVAGPAPVRPALPALMYAAYSPSIAALSSCSRNLIHQLIDDSDDSISWLVSSALFDKSPAMADAAVNQLHAINKARPANGLPGHMTQLTTNMAHCCHLNNIGYTIHYAYLLDDLGTANAQASNELIRLSVEAYPEDLSRARLVIMPFPTLNLMELGLTMSIMKTPPTFFHSVRP